MPNKCTTKTYIRHYHSIRVVPQPLLIMKISKDAVFQTVLQIPQNFRDDHSLDISIFLRTVLRFGYYFLVIPFRIGNDGIQIFRLQRILVGFSYAVTVFQYLNEIRQFPKSLNKNPVDYFLFFQRVASAMVRFCMFKIVWCDAHKFVKVLETVRTCSKPITGKRTTIFVKAVILSICSIYAMIGVFTWVCGIRVTEELIYRDISAFYRSYVERARYSFFITGAQAKLQPNSEISLLSHFVTFLLLLTNYFRSINGTFFDVVFMMTSLTLWIPCRQFSNRLKGQISQNQLTSGEVDETLSLYAKLQNLAHVINETMEFGILALVGEAVLYYSVYFNAIFIAADWFRKLRVSIFMIGMIFTFITAADLVRQVSQIRRWVRSPNVICHLNDNSRQFRVTVLLEELRDNPVSLSGVILKITYAFNGTLLTTLVTYFIVCSSINPID